MSLPTTYEAYLLGGVATAMDFMDVLRDYDERRPTIEVLEAEIEWCFADAFVHFGNAFRQAAASIGDPDQQK